MRTQIPASRHRVSRSRWAFVATLVASSALLVSACAGSEDGVFEGNGATGGSSAGTAGTGGSSGGQGGTLNGGSGGTGNAGSGNTGNGGSGAGGSGGSGNAGTGGANGGNGGSAAGGSGGTGNGGSMGTCNPAFCPNSGFGTPCCVTNNGPCGYDTGMGCQQSTGDV
ncbi:MAG: hypothetical protein H6716_01000 [Polyangiaceae bacterium]|nr:hypothetical protein [Polyangiaceae bacterium]